MSIHVTRVVLLMLYLSEPGEDNQNATDTPINARTEKRVKRPLRPALLRLPTHLLDAHEEEFRRATQSSFFSSAGNGVISRHSLWQLQSGDVRIERSYTGMIGALLKEVPPKHIGSIVDPKQKQHAKLRHDIPERSTCDRAREELRHFFGFGRSNDRSLDKSLIRVIRRKTCGPRHRTCSGAPF